MAIDFRTMKISMERAESTEFRTARGGEVGPGAIGLDEDTGVYVGENTAETHSGDSV
jgi:hypothetical protein